MKHHFGWAYPDADDFMWKEMTADGGYQAEHLTRALRHVTDTSMAIDGGAHVGTWTRIMSQRFDHVIAYEPSLDTYKALVDNLVAFCCENVIAKQMALGACAGHVRMVLDPVQAARSNTGGRRVEFGGEIPVETVDSLRLKTLGFLKLDVEGSEPAALEGAKETLARCRPIVLFEDKALWTTHYGLPKGAVEDILMRLRYRFLEKVGRDQIWGPA